ncbi:complement C1q-like protein 4 [Saccostrea echinata]|uniref:complement C1q-like protein 4 n=1 Tax=Saccostrea echinata TaxID=191078 RepID=UPI002A7F4204|nr:complement C1q-like protein 4 [Saccostrea echinata]
MRHVFLLLWICILASTKRTEGRSLMAHLMRQAGNLKHGLELAARVGDIGSHKNDVAFTAVTSSGTTYSSSRTIAFNRLLLNHGNAYSTSNYRFTAPSEGLYVFSWSLALLKGSRYNGNVHLIRNGSAYQSTNCANTYQQCGSTVAMWLGKNNQVWIQTRSSNVYVYGTYSSFSGWKTHW